MSEIGFYKGELTSNHFENLRQHLKTCGKPAEKPDQINPSVCVFRGDTGDQSVIIDQRALH